MKFSGKISAVLGVVLAVGLSVVLPVPAYAAGSGTIGNASGVLYSGCRDISVPYSISLGPDVESWDVSITVYAPDGLEADSEYLSAGSDPTSGRFDVNLCSYQGAGRYSMDGEGTAYDYDFNASSIYIESGTLKVRLPKTRTSIKVVKKPKNRMLITVGVKDERPNGYYPTEYADVKLQAFIGGRWQTANQGTGFTDSRGIETWLYKRTIRLKARAVMVQDGYQKSISRVIYVPGR